MLDRSLGRATRDQTGGMHRDRPVAGINVTVPEADLRRVEDAEARFLATIRGLSDGDVAHPTGLPGWTVGHVLTHVARNADSHCRRSHAAARGEVVEQYVGGYAGRAAE